jgi:hypothetical protein
LAIAPCSGADARKPRGLRPLASPSAIVATEFAFATEAQQKGQWRAFADYAADDAIMFEPQLVEAKGWLKKQANPAQAVKWQPYSVWMSCDGSMAVTKGAWQGANGTNGYFTTVWQQQNNGRYKWTLDQGDTLAQPLPAPEMVSGDVADCSRPRPLAAPAAVGGVVQRVGWSDDKTLQWVVEVRPDGSRSFRVNSWNGSGYKEVLRSDVAAK